ncbi:MAG: glycosyl hydrolase [Minicystis sp.]
MNTTSIAVSTRKGLWFFHSDDRQRWSVDGPHHFGSMVHHTVLDPRDGRTMLCATRTGHLGPALMRTLDGGKTWTQARVPPAFLKGEERKRAVDHVFWLTPGHASEPGVWYAGTSPQGLFRSEDGGETWAPVSGFNDHPEQQKWVHGDQDQTPDGGKTHSILVDPRDPAHLYVGLSGGGFFESRDTGASWDPLNGGVAMDFAPPLPDGGEYPYGHDPHCVVLSAQRPDRLWRQDHCGMYRLDRDQSPRWERVGKAMPKEIGDIGFPIAVHPRDPDTAWVFPMDGTSVWPRTSPGGKPAVYATHDAGASWARQDKGFPAEQGWWTVKRQCLVVDAGDPVGLYLGTTNGEVWTSADEGASFARLGPNLPHIYALSVSASA